jgi:tRNA threonylcarbamoyladenosine biosynthesis protein TsaE
VSYSKLDTRNCTLETLLYYCNMEIAVHSIEDLDHITEVLLRHIGDGYNIFLLSGDLGSGKTTLTQRLCRQLAVNELISSPTFSLVNEYQSPEVGTIYHMDLYRLEKPEDLAQIGFEEYLDSGFICLIEWPGIADQYFTMPHIRVNIEVTSNNIRIFNITTHDAVDA